MAAVDSVLGAAKRVAGLWPISRRPTTLLHRHAWVRHATVSAARRPQLYNQAGASLSPK